ncbi:MAG: flagellar basal-body rod protein FlgF [Methylobacter sp.]|jgi:flagellar basal-body rod protein FlgF|nr:flagellar basal-body rod protein FlgF [Methylobacter sp.]
MDRSLYIAMSGAKQTLLAQAANANNLANTQTTGFKSDLEQFRSRPLTGAGYPSRVYAMNEKPWLDFSPGATQTTGNDLDVAIKGEGYLAVQGADGKEAYSRAGDLRVTPEGVLETGAGLQVLGQDGPILIPPAEKLTIGGDGTISIIPLGAGNATTQVEVGQIKLVKVAPENLEKGNDGLLHSKDGNPVAANVDVALASGVLEGSNVNAITAMVDMIELARNFELQTKVMKSVDENAAAGTKLMQMS